MVLTALGFFFFYSLRQNVKLMYNLVFQWLVSMMSGFAIILPESNKSVFECTGIKNHTERNPSYSKKGSNADFSTDILYSIDQHAKQSHEKFDYKVRIWLHLI